MTSRWPLLVCIGLALVVFGALCAALAADDTPQAADGPISAEAARKLKSPVPYDKESIARGKTLYILSCRDCHGDDGKSQLDVIANATDLTDPKQWTSGISEGEIFRSIRDGAGEAMPPFKTQVEKTEDMWHMVNFIRSLWPVSARPALVEK